MTVTENLYWSFCVDSTLILDVEVKVVWLGDRMLKVKVAIGDGNVESPKYWQFELKGRTSSAVQDFVENPGLSEMLALTHRGDEAAEKLNLPSEAEILLDEEIELRSDVLKTQLYIRQSRRSFDLEIGPAEDSLASMRMSIINGGGSEQDLVVSFLGTKWAQTHSAPTITSDES